MAPIHFLLISIKKGFLKLNICVMERNSDRLAFLSHVTADVFRERSKYEIKIIDNTIL